MAFVRKAAMAVIALVIVAQFADAGPFRNRRAARYQQPAQQWQPAEVAAAVATAMTVDASVQESEDALDEVNATRAASGLRPFIRDNALTRAAASCARFRAARLMSGHTSNDFNALPEGSSAGAAGCAAWPVGMGWGSCCTFESWQYAGAAWVVGRDGNRYMHLFVR